MEQVNLLQTHEANQDSDDDEDVHPFLTEKYDNKSFHDSPNFKIILICIVTFMIALFLGFLIGTNIAPEHMKQMQDLVLTTKSPTQSQPIIPANINSNLNQKNTPKPTPNPTNKQTTSKPTNKPITTTSKPTNKPTTSTTTSTTTTTTTTTTNQAPQSNKDTPLAKSKIVNGEIVSDSFIYTQLLTNLAQDELAKLRTDVQLISVTEKDGMHIQTMDTMYGAAVFHYAHNTDTKYPLNILHRTCFNFQFLATAINENVLIQIKFNKFKLENGFDRILIRHFNKSFADMPLSYSGYQPDLYIQYLLERGTNKSICIEFQSDETITNDGIDYNLKLVYDLCKWSKYNDCYAMNLWGKRWSRGPFMNGKCGLGITSKHRNQDNSPITTNNLNGLLQNCNANTNNISSESHIEYCIKRTCEDWNNFNDPEFDPKKVPGQGWYNLSRYYNGHGRIDPIYADPFRLYFATENNLFKNINDDWINKLKLKFTEKRKEIIDYHQDIRILEYAIMAPIYQKISGEFIGAKIIDSLVNGQPFIVALCGDSVTSGHDNMVMSTYPFQLQSRWRKWWTDIGNKGATFAVRNFAVGGGISSDSQGFMPVSMITETFPNAFNKLSDIIDNKYDIWYRNGYPIRKLDFVTFEYYFTEGGGTHSSRELHMRESAYLGAVWGVINPIQGVQKIEQACKPWQQLNASIPQNWKQFDSGRFLFMKDEYEQNMGTVAMNPNYGMVGVCPLFKNGTVTLSANSKNEDDGKPVDGMTIAYSPWYLKVNWHPTSMGHRVMSDVMSYWMINSAIQFINKYKDEMYGYKDINSLNVFLKQKGGTWRQDIIKSIIDKKLDEWVTPEYCGVKDIKEKEDVITKPQNAKQYNDYCESIPFMLTNIEPTTYNTHNLLNEYVYDAYGNGTIWKNYIQHAQWRWSTSDSIISIVRKKGTEGNMDTFWSLKPDASFFSKKFNEMYKDKTDNNNLEGFHKYLIENRIYLQFVIKTPKYGSGRIKIFNSYHCDENMQREKLVKVYVNKLDDIQDTKGNIILGKDLSALDCIQRDLELNTKYVVSYVPYNVTSVQPAFSNLAIYFLAAY